MNLPTGTLYGANQAFIVQATGQLNKAADYAPLIVTYRNGAPVRLADVGTVRDSVENDKTATWFFDREVGVAARHPAGDPAPAGNEYGRSRRQHQATAARLSGADAAFGADEHSLRPVG